MVSPPVPCASVVEIQSPPFSGSTRRSFGLLERTAVFAVLFLVEWGSLTHLVHKGYGAGQLFQFAVVFFSLLLAFGYARAQSLFRCISGELDTTPIGWSFLPGHGIALLAFVG